MRGVGSFIIRSFNSLREIRLCNAMFLNFSSAQNPKCRLGKIPKRGKNN